MLKPVNEGLKRALIIGIDQYSDPDDNLTGCVNDAIEINRLLSTNSDGSPNFETTCIVSSDCVVTHDLIMKNFGEQFFQVADTMLLYFSGHTAIDPNSENVFLATQDSLEPNQGIDLHWLNGFLNIVSINFKSIIVILDCCNAGALGNVREMYQGIYASNIPSGVSILVACKSDESAYENNGHGKFTSMIIDGLTGAASNLLGQIPFANLSAHAQTIFQHNGQQNPVIKINEMRFLNLRTVEPRISESALLQIPEIFPNADAKLELDPTFIPNSTFETEIPNVISNEVNLLQIYAFLLEFEQHTLIEPENHDSIQQAAECSGSCRLTKSGKYYRNLMEKYISLINNGN